MYVIFSNIIDKNGLYEFAFFKIYMYGSANDFNWDLHD